MKMLGAARGMLTHKGTLLVLGSCIGLVSVQLNRPEQANNGGPRMVLKPFKATRASVFALNHINVSDCRTTPGSSDAFPPGSFGPDPPSLLCDTSYNFSLDVCKITT